MSTPTSLPPDPFGEGLPGTGVADRLVSLWQKPLAPLLPAVRETMGKPLAEVTMQELIACLITFGYIFSSVVIAETMLMNLVKVAVRGR